MSNISNHYLPSPKPFTVQIIPIVWLYDVIVSQDNKRWHQTIITSILAFFRLAMRC